MCLSILRISGDIVSTVFVFCTRRAVVCVAIRPNTSPAVKAIGSRLIYNSCCQRVISADMMMSASAHSSPCHLRRSLEIATVIAV